MKESDGIFWAASPPNQLGQFVAFDVADFSRELPDRTLAPDPTLASGEYFVMADNRSDACDSRVFGPISKSSVVGEGIAIVGRNGHVSFGTL